MVNVGKKAKVLRDLGFDTVEKLASATMDQLTAIKGIGEVTAKKIIEEAKEFLA